METDPNYEYDAPKWFDFIAENEQLGDELSLDDSWFEREHPLHEPKDPNYYSATDKPLVSRCQGNKAELSKGKPRDKKPAKKDYGSKKSLGLRTIRTRRGQHGNQARNENCATSTETGKLSAQNAEQQVSLKEGKKDSNGTFRGDGRETPDEIMCDKKCSFTPPWTDSPKTEDTPHDSSKEGSESSLNDVAVFSPRSAKLSHSPMSPVRIRSLKSSSSSASPSPKTSLLHKAMTGACRQGPRRRRRLLPAIPDVNTTSVEGNGIKSLPDLHLTQSGDGTCQKTTTIPQSSKTSEKPSLKEATVVDTCSMKPLRATDMRANIGASNNNNNYCSLPRHGNEFCKDENNTFTGRSLCVIPESNYSEKGNNQVLASTDCEKQKSTRCETGLLSNNKSLEALLKMHNKKVVSARSQYDDNGRRIKTAEPNFCPAPAKTLSASCKRFAPTVEKPVGSAKQKRRSCMASVINTQSEITKGINTCLTSSNTSTENNKKGKESSSKQTTKQKRRSCMASLQNNGLTETVDKELRNLITQHNSRVSARKS